MDRAAADVAKLEAKHAAVRAVPAATVEAQRNPLAHYAALDELGGQIVVARDELVRQQGLLVKVQDETAPWIEAYA